LGPAVSKTHRTDSDVIWFTGTRPNFRGEMARSFANACIQQKHAANVVLGQFRADEAIMRLIRLRIWVNPPPLALEIRSGLVFE
jgi:hypothetical protein